MPILIVLAVALVALAFYCSFTKSVWDDAAQGRDPQQIKQILIRIDKIKKALDHPLDVDQSVLDRLMIKLHIFHDNITPMNTWNSNPNAVSVEEFMKMEDIEIADWIYQRLVFQHGEKRTYGYMVRFDRLIKDIGRASV